MARISILLASLGMVAALASETRTPGGQSKVLAPVSIVDYLKATGQASDRASRAKLFREKVASPEKEEEYTGSAAQNIRLLQRLLEQRKQLLVPMPSSDIEHCRAFYAHTEIAKYLTPAFRGNAVKACMVTGTSKPSSDIREHLQKIYRERPPADGKTFTASEHKQIHDDAYKAAGCKEDSAGILGWYVMDSAEFPAEVVKFAIDWFGKCTVSADPSPLPQPNPRK